MAELTPEQLDFMRALGIVGATWEIDPTVADPVEVTLAGLTRSIGASALGNLISRGYVRRTPGVQRAETSDDRSPTAGSVRGGVSLTAAGEDVSRRPGDVVLTPEPARLEIHASRPDVRVSGPMGANVQSVAAQAEATAHEATVSLSASSMGSAGADVIRWYERIPNSAPAPLLDPQVRDEALMELRKIEEDLRNLIDEIEITANERAALESATLDAIAPICEAIELGPQIENQWEKAKRLLLMAWDRIRRATPIVVVVGAALDGFTGAMERAQVLLLRLLEL